VSKARPSTDSANGVAAASNGVLADSAKDIAQHLMKFDTLDFDVFNNQKWDRLKESHAPDIVVTWPDGHEARGLDKHIEDLKAMFVATPDFRIDEHPVKIANGHWTAVTGHVTATFSKPMPIGGGKTIPPTGKKLSLNMVTVGHWTDAGVMDHEGLFWDNAAYAKQLGLTP
jgi:predicted ester cyclase